ncbi:possible DnaB-like helicase [Prochlorococcus marinus str. MIT 9313]|uniref:Possible DnaB-like helicase n=1 Tax=Prochlorococcus marinus (strain MIT 9313) TaxID=74547 RepID=Q7V7M7_PROMM|nr:hypothetical protein [Prochlorococcus marinus]CAE20888.1 possible DnaB-like helicase [Prochlorococcus marinus str. MIT 9313]
MIKTLFGLLQTLKRGLRLTDFVVLASLFLVLMTENYGRQASQTSQSPPLNIATVNHLDPTDFRAEELRYLQKRFGVHGPQTPLAQLFTQGIDHLQPLRAQTVNRLDELKPVIVRESKRYRVNPMLVTAILFDEIQHSKPGENIPFVAHSGLLKTHGPAQLGISELIHQKRLPQHPTAEQISSARNLLLNPESNIELLAGKIARLKDDLGLPSNALIQASRSYKHAKAIATLAYLHNGKLDYPARILRYMQDPELHGLIYSQRSSAQLPLI